MNEWMDARVHDPRDKEEEETLTAERELSPQLSQRTPSKSSAYRSPPIAPRAGLPSLPPLLCTAKLGWGFDFSWDGEVWT